MSALRRVLVWFVLVSLAMASGEALAFCLTQPAGTGPTFTEFIQCFSGTFFLLLLLNCVVGAVVWFFLVWLGGVRPGIALFFMLSGLVLFGLMTLSIDVALNYSTRLAVYRGAAVVQVAYMALLASTAASLILGKVYRRSALISVSPRPLAIVAFLLLGASLAAWAASAGILKGATWWATMAMAALLCFIFLWWLSRSPMRLGFLLGASSVAFLAPLPWVFSGPPEHGAETAAATVSHPVRRVILVTVDTLRRDALGCYAPGSANTPHFDEIAKSGTLFNNAFSSSPWTLPSTASILTGVTPRVHQLQEAAAVLPENLPTLAGYLKGAGYHTGAVGWNAHLGPASELDRGFDDYNWFPVQRLTAKTFEMGLSHRLLASFSDKRAPASTLTDEAISWVTKNAGRDFFLWVHYLDPHMPYMPPDEFQPTDPDQLLLGRRFWDLQRARTGHTARTAAERAWIRTLYDGDVRYVDQQFGRLVEALKKLNIYEESLIIVTADHGEEFWDHDRFEHGHTLYNELIRVPLVVKQPNSSTAATVDAYVGTQAIMPTIMDLCGIAPHSTEGLLRSFLPLLRDPQAAFDEGCLFTGACIFQDYQEGVIFNRMKYTRSKLSGHEKLFNLAEDPKELNSLVAHDPVNLARGRQLLEQAIAGASKTIEQLGVGEGRKDMIKVDVHKLQSMGYL